MNNFEKQKKQKNRRGGDPAFGPGTVLRPSVGRGPPGIKKISDRAGNEKENLDFVFLEQHKFQAPTFPRLTQSGESGA